jgi:hypothetical protein
MQARRLLRERASGAASSLSGAAAAQARDLLGLARLLETRGPEVVMEGKIVVVGTDFADTGDEAIRAGLAQLTSGAAQTLHVVHVLNVKGALLP